MSSKDKINNITIEGNFNYLESEPYTEKTYHYTYDEEWLKLDPKNTPYDMLRFSLCLAMAASKQEYITNLYNQLGYNYTNNVNEEAEKLNVLAGDKITDSVYYPAQEIDGKLYYNSIAYAIGSKETYDFTTIIAAIRGGDYGLEWGSNFNIGLGEDFEGFSIAADQVLSGIKDYIKRNNITGRIKVWAVGYSRAAATANLVASRLIKGEIDGIEANDVYGFTFECPRTTRADNALDSCFDGIINVANPDDVVPKLAMSVWGYKRYGKTLFLPAYQTDKNYLKERDRKEALAREIMSNDLDPAENDDYTVKLFVEDLALAAGGLENYNKVYQDALVKITAIFLGGAKAEPTRDELITLDILAHNLIDIDPENAEKMAILFGSKNGNLFMINPACNLLKVHFMVNTFAWIESFKDYKDFGENKVRYIYINNALEVEVTSKDKGKVLEVKEGKIIPSNNSLYSRVDQNKQLVIACPVNEEIEVHVSKAEDNTLNYMIQEYDMVTGLPGIVYDYGKIELGNKTFVSSMPENTNNYFAYLEDNDSKDEVQPEYLLKGDEIENYTIVAKVEGKGRALGGGYYTIGEYAAFTAIEEKEDSFEGWYVGDNLLSKEHFYKFPVKESLVLTARFK